MFRQEDTKDEQNLLSPSTRFWLSDGSIVSATEGHTLEQFSHFVKRKLTVQVFCH